MPLTVLSHETDYLMEYSVLLNAGSREHLLTEIVVVAEAVAAAAAVVVIA